LLGFTDAQVRKDLAYFGHFGYPGIGYRCEELIQAIRHILGTDKAWSVAMVGVGNLGRALLGYRGFGNQNFRIVAAFDLEAERIGPAIEGVPIYHTDKLSEIVRGQHIKLGMVVVPLISLFAYGGLFGWASAPLDPLWVSRFPKRSAMVAIAGPVANIILAAIAMVVMFIGVKNGVFHEVRVPWFHEFVRGNPGTVWEYAGYVVSLTFFLNIFLAVLNLMPVPPLDGSNIPLFFLNDRAADSYQQLLRQPWMFLVSIVLLFKLFPFIFVPVYKVVVKLAYACFY
jgi:Zn-dependent protease